MEDNYFVENDKFLSLNGVIGRRGFVVNYFIILLIKSLILSTPIMYILLTNPKFMINFVQSSGPNYPLWWILWVMGAGIIDCILYYPSIVRRIRDIIGEVDENRVSLISSILIVILFLGYGLSWYTPILGWIGLFTILLLMFTKGKITSSRPHKELLKFNWGAFLGTWLWGLFNKTPVTLFMLPLSLTTGWLPFMVLCGLKGNEWAYANKTYETPEDFHKSQSNQAAIWAILFPIILIVGFITLSIASGAVMYKYMKSNPKAIENLNRIVNEYQDVAVKTNFTKIEISDNEYKFYMEPQIWVKLPETSKESMFKVATNYLSAQKNIDLISGKNNLKELEIMNNIKIYSSFNNEILGEYSVDIEEISKVYSDIEKGKKARMKEYLNLLKNGYKFNTHPTLP